MKKTPTKPKIITRKSFDFSDCTKFIEQKYGIDTTDYAGANLDFSRWCKLVGEPLVRTTSSSPDSVIQKGREQYSRYRADVDTGKFVEQPYQNWWHWLIEAVDAGHNSTFELDPELAEKGSWERDILDLYLKEFGRGPYYVK